MAGIQVHIGIITKRFSMALVLLRRGPAELRGPGTDHRTILSFGSPLVTSSLFRDQLIDRATTSNPRLRKAPQTSCSPDEPPGNIGHRKHQNLNFCKLCPCPCLTTRGEVGVMGDRRRELPLREVVRLLDGLRGRGFHYRCLITAMRRKAKGPSAEQPSERN
jgi:hypothetical protein